jgi:acyl-CoA synthetase (AMP-forming)/AMP-acid ligase II
VVRKLPKEIQQGYYLPYRGSARRTAIWDFVADIPFDSSHPSYAEMLHLGENLELLKDTPVQIIWGLRDPCFHRGMLNKVAGRFPHAHILEIPDASHLVLEDAPELTSRTIRDFLLNHRGVDASRIVQDRKAANDQEDLIQGNSLYMSFQKIAGEQEKEPAVIESLFLGDSVRYSHVTFGDLQRRINQYQRGLAELGLSAGDKVLMLVPPGDEFLALSYAVMGRGAIPIFIDPGIGRENLFRCIGDINPDVLIGSPRAQLLRLKKKQLLPNLKFHLTASEWVYTGGPTLSYLKRFSSRSLPPAESGDVAFIAFTSGATGLPKGVIFTSEMLEEQLRIFTEVIGIRPGDKDLPLLPIFSLFQMALGVCSVFPPIDSAKPLSLSPDKVMKLIEDLQISSSFGSPTLWNKIAEYCVRSGTTLGPLKKILMAGAPVPAGVLERVQKLMDKDGVAFTPYGATEALPVTLVRSQEILDRVPFPAKGGEQGTYVGKSIDGIELRVIRPVAGELAANEMQDLAPGEIGEVVVRGANVSPAYFQREDATRIAKIADGEGFWHRMGDMGYLDSEGGLYFCGRKTHAVAHVERVYYSVPTERIFNQHPKVKRSALIDVGQNQRPGIVIEPYPQHWPENSASKEEFLAELREIAAANEITRPVECILFHQSFPVDSRHNAKIFRDKLAIWAKETLTESK